MKEVLEDIKAQVTSEICPIRGDKLAKKLDLKLSVFTKGLAKTMKLTKYYLQGNYIWYDYNEFLRKFKESKDW